MRITLLITDEVSDQPNNEYAPKRKVTHVDVEEMDADASIVASLLRGAASRIDSDVHKSQIHYPYGTSTNMRLS